MNKIFSLLIVFIALLSYSENSYSQTSAQTIKELSKSYFAVYAERENWEAFLNFYDEDVYFEDVQFRLICNGLDTFSRFYDWPNLNYKKVDESKPILQVNHLIVNDSVVIAQGFFDSFYWQDALIMGPWEFTISLTFNKQGKIVKQRDFINYPLYFLCGNTKLEKDAALWMENRKHLVQHPK